MEVKMTNKLKPCPFCGSEVQMITGMLANVTMFSCKKCMALMSFRGAEIFDKAVERFNRRAKNE